MAAAPTKGMAAAPPQPRHPHHRHSLPVDWVMLGLVIAASIPFIFANGAIFRYRKRRFFRGQGGAMLILGASFGGLIWIMSAFVINGHFHRRGKLLLACPLWTFWLQGTLGFCLWFACIILRLYRMLLLSKQRDIPAWRYVLYLFISLLPTIALSITASFVPAYMHGKHCKLKKTFVKIVWLVQIPPYLCLLAVVLFKLRGSKDPVLEQEYVNTSEHMGMSCLVVVLSGVTFLIRSQEHPAGRCFLTFCSVCLVFSHFWVRFGRPVYLCLFRHPQEMNEFEEELYRSGARGLESIEAMYAQRSQNHASSEGAVLEAISNTAEELAEYTAEIRKLEKEREALLSLLRKRGQ